MSLVNDMLRDLAARQHEHEPSGTHDSDMLLHDSSLLQRQRYNWLPSVMVFVVVLLLAISVPKLYSLLISSPTSKSVTIADEPIPVSMQDVLPPPTLMADVAVAESAPLLVETIDDVALKNSHSEQQLERIYRLLQQAERALTLDRLTAPLDDNAYHYYREILLIAPDNVPAQEGLQRIAQRYLHLAQDAYGKGDHARVDSLLQRAELVAPGYERIAAQRQQWMALPTDLHSVEELNELTAEPASVPVATLSVAEAGQGHFDITPNSAWQDQQAVAQAALLISQGQHQAAALSLQQFIARHQQPIKATAALFDVYLQQENYVAGRMLLQQARPYLPVQDSAHMTARLLVAQGQHDAALSVLEKELDHAVPEEAYRALLAALYHKTGRYQESVSNYRRLLDSFGEKPAYWLGLALALDALQQSTSALEAYRRIGLQEAQPQVKDYVEQRIAALSH